MKILIVLAAVIAICVVVLVAALLVATPPNFKGETRRSRIHRGFFGDGPPRAR